MVRQVLILILCISIVANISSYRSTSDVAQETGYYAFITNLRNDANEHLNKMEDESKRYVQELSGSHMYDLAEAKKLQIEDIFTRTEQEFNDKFEEIDRVLVLEGDRLNDDNVPVPEKKEFVNKLRDRAKSEIQEIIDRSNQQIKNIKREEGEVQEHPLDYILT